MSAPTSLNIEAEETTCLVVSSSVADTTRKELERLQLLNKEKRLKHQKECDKVAIPLKLSQGPNTTPHDEMHVLTLLKDAICPKPFKENESFEIQHMVMPQSKKSVLDSPAIVLKRRLEKLFQTRSCPWKQELETDIPTQWETHGDLVLLDSSAFASPEWRTFGDSLWVTVTECLSCKRVAQKSCVSTTGFRTPQVKLLYGEDTWVDQTDNGIRFTYDVTKCMFSAGNITEKLRVAKLDCTQEIVVDMYAGTGYFSLPYLVHARAKHLHACEWNPDALEALRRNLVLNRVADMCTVHFGDNRLVCPKGIADRVNLGLLPSSEEGWPTACAALNPLTGGVLHIHGNVSTKPRSPHKDLCHRNSRTATVCEGTNEIEGNLNVTNQIKCNFSNVTNQITCDFSNGTNQCEGSNNHVTSYTEIDPPTGTNRRKVVNSHLTTRIGVETAECNAIVHPALKTTELEQIDADWDKMLHEDQILNLIHENKNQTEHKDQEYNDTIELPRISESKRKFLPWAIEVCKKIQTLLQTTRNGHWRTTIIHIERVKSYAPHIDHIVLDLDCRPVNH